MRRHWFFDFDGTLADTDRDIRDAWKLTIRDLGLACDDFDSKFRNGPPIDAMVELLFPGRATDELKLAVRERFKVNYDAGGFPHTAPYPGVEEFLRRLAAAGAEIFVASNKRFRALNLLVSKLGWGGLIAGVYAPDMFPGRRMTKAEFLAHALAERGIAPTDAVMAGDTRGDVDAAKANGVFALGCDWGYAPRSELDGADRVIGLDDLRKLETTK